MVIFYNIVYKLKILTLKTTGFCGLDLIFILKSKKYGVTFGKALNSSKLTWTSKSCHLLKQFEYLK